MKGISIVFLARSRGLLCSRSKTGLSYLPLLLLCLRRTAETSQQSPERHRAAECQQGGPERALGTETVHGILERECPAKTARVLLNEKLRNNAQKGPWTVHGLASITTAFILHVFSILRTAIILSKNFRCLFDRSLHRSKAICSRLLVRMTA